MMGGSAGWHSSQQDVGGLFSNVCLDRNPIFQSTNEDQALDDY